MTGDRLPAVPLDSIPSVTADQMREVDRIMIEELGVMLVQMMENAGRALAALALRRFAPATATVLAGPGGNGGGGLAAARHLANRGVEVAVALGSPVEAMTEVAARQLTILQRMGVPAGDPVDADLIVDAVIGYSLRGDPRGRAAELISWTDRQGSPVLALDTPSGLDVTTGAAADPCVAATATLTLALPKTGLAGAPQVGELYLADISVPQLVYERLGLGRVEVFAESQLVRLT